MSHQSDTGEQIIIPCFGVYLAGGPLCGKRLFLQEFLQRIRMPIGGRRIAVYEMSHRHFRDWDYIRYIEYDYTLEEEF